MRATAGAALALATVLWVGAIPASAAPTTAPGLCGLLPTLCPPTTTATTPPTLPPTTKAPVPTTTHATAPARASKSSSASTSARVSTAKAPVGVGALMAPVELPAIGTGTDPAAPQLAGTSAPTTVVTHSTLPPTLSGIVGTTKGLPNDHSTARIALSILAVLAGALAVAQLPVSRRSPIPGGDALD